MGELLVMTQVLMNQFGDLLHSLRFPNEPLVDLSRRDHATIDTVKRCHPTRPLIDPFDLPRNLPHVHLRYQGHPNPTKQGFHVLARKRPDGDKLEKPRFDPPSPGIYDRPLCRPSHRAVGDDYDLGILRQVMLHELDGMEVLTDFSEQPVEERLDLVGAGGGETPHIVNQAGHMVPVAVPENPHRRDPTTGIFVRNVPLRRHGRLDPVQHLDLIRIWQYHLLPGMSDDFISEDDYRSSIALREIEGLNRNIEGIADTGRRQHNDGVVAVGAPTALHNVALRGIRGQAGGRPTAHHVHDDAGYLCHAGEPKVLLHEREAR